jgi:hypothetical protein
LINTFCEINSHLLVLLLLIIVPVILLPLAPRIPPAAQLRCRRLAPGAWFGDRVFISQNVVIF